MRNILLAAIILYIFSLVLPVMVYRPDTLDNEKYGFCSLATRDEYRCLKNGADYSCVRIDSGTPVRSDTMSRTDITTYCGTGWDEPEARQESGWVALTTHWRFFQAGLFSWYAHVFLLLSFLFAGYHKPRSAAASALSALVLTATAFLVTRLPRMGGGSDLVVDHLGIGYFVWVTAIALFAWYHITNLFKKVN